MRHKTVFYLLAATLAIAALIWLWRSAWVLPPRAFRELLEGSPAVRIESLEFVAEGKQVTINDPALTAYLSNAFRAATLEPGQYGKTYSTSIRLVPGGSVRCQLDVPSIGDCICVSQAMPWYIADPLDYYLVRLPQPVPPALARLIAGLR